MVEVLIAGAGPAGSVAATILARAGVRVLLVDRARFPRPKLCGDTLNPGTVADLRRLGLDGGPLDRAVAIGGMLLTGPGSTRILGRYPPGTQGLAVPRRDLDAHLVAGACAAGAQFQDGVAARGLLLDARPEPAVRGLALEAPNGRRLRVPAAVTIAADGRRSRLAQLTGLARYPARPRRWVVGAYFDGVAHRLDAGEMHVRKGYYLGIAPLPDGLTNVCLVTPDRSGLGHPADLLDRVIRSEAGWRERFERARMVSTPAILGPLAVDAAGAGMSGLLLAGDAAGFIDPMTGDGLRFAVRGGELAAQAALEMLANGRLDGHRRLVRRRRREFGRKWRFNRLLRRVVAAPWSLSLASLGAHLHPAVFQRLILVAGDVG